MIKTRTNHDILGGHSVAVEQGQAENLVIPFYTKNMPVHFCNVF